MFESLESLEMIRTTTFMVCSLALLAIYVLTVIHILINKHEEPASAMLWILVVLDFPFIGIMIYLLFGINRLKTTGLSVQLSNEIVNAEKKGILFNGMGNYFRNQIQHIAKYPDYQRNTFNYNRTLDRLLPETLPMKGNSLELLHDGTMAYPRMLKAIESAQHNIHLQSFIIMNDEIGKAIFDALARKASNGVKVKVLYDRFGSSHAILSHFFRKYSGKIPNLQIKSFMRINLFTPWRIQLRNHRKLLVVDGKTAFIGGINISSNNISGSDSTKYKYIHDLHCCMEGSAVGELQFSFLRDWCFATNFPPSKIFTEENFPPLDSALGDGTVRIIDTGPGQNPEGSQKVFFTAATTSQKYIWIMTPYFVPDKPFISALCMAAARGVDVKLIVPKNNNHWYVDFACKSLYEKLLSDGIRIFEKMGSFSHVKAMIVDGEWTVMGSSNCDVRSFRLNFELDFVAYGGQFISDVREQFLKELYDSCEITTSDMKNKKFSRELAENICSLLTPVL
ncbi:MAG: cardiolipin synthase [Lentisphaerae bacterium GWF2_45_14]|nr:MAG: cardiolipin synthase [Lentisphaerae bacterium GWF2_45_14]